MSGYLIVLLFGFMGLTGVTIVSVVAHGSRTRRFDIAADQAIDLTGGTR